ncbi:MAG: hypothetical protein ACRBHB_21345 [Arenicella sp.]
MKNNNNKTESSTPVACDDSVIFTEKAQNKRFGLKLEEAREIPKPCPLPKSFRVLF